MNGNGSHTDASDDRPSLLNFVCERCLSAFEPEYDFCPTCDGPMPSEGWRRTRDFPDAWLGRRIERYRIDQRIGKGAAGAVYRVSRPHLEDNYAFKVINLDMAGGSDQGPSLRTRVEREVRILSTISSPHIVGFHDFVELDNGGVAVVMDYVRGSTLGDVLDEEEPSLERSLQIAIEVAAGLRDAHSRDVVHRDLKPENVMVHDPGGRGEFVELIDFGVARFESEVSRTVGFIGTPRYTSPEQARGESVGTASDIYNLGMLLFHMLAGQPPFVQDNINELLEAHSRQQAPHPSAVAEREIPPEFDAYVRRMLAKDPADRPDDAETVLDRLRWLQAQVTGEGTGLDPGETQQPGDSVPDPLETGPPSAFDRNHETDNYGKLSEDRQSGGTGQFERPPSDVFDVSERGSIVYRDDDNRLRVRQTVGSDPDDAPDDTILEEFSTPVTAVAVDGGEALLGHEDGTIRSIDVESGAVDELFRDGDRGPVAGVDRTPNGSRAVAGFENGDVIYCDFEAASEQWHSLPSGASVASVGIHEDGSCIAVARRNETTEIFVPNRSRDQHSSLLEHDASPEKVGFSPDGYLVAVQFPDGSAQLFSALTGHHVSDAPDSSVLQPSSVFETQQ